MEGVDKWMSFFDMRAGVFRNGVRNNRRVSCVYVGYNTEKFALPVLHPTVLVRVTVLVL